MSDPDRLTAWFEALPRGTEAERAESRRKAIAVAHRAAMRSLPLLWAATRRSQSDVMQDIGADALHLCLASGVAAARPTPEILAVASHPRGRRDPPEADSGIQSTIRKSNLSSAGIEDIFYAIANVRGVFAEPPQFGGLWQWSDPPENVTSIEADCEALEEGQAIEKLPLWHGPNPLAATWAELRSHMSEEDGEESFWITWYERVLRGYPPDENLLTKIALIPAQDWAKGPLHLNAIIAEIVRSHQSNSPQLNQGTIKLIQRTVAANTEVLPLQLAALLQVIDDEYERLRGDNALDPELRERMLAAFQRIRDAAIGIGVALPDQGAPDEVAAIEIGRWGAVLASALKHWNNEAKKIVLGREADPRVAFGSRVVVGGAVAGVLIGIGLPGYATLAGGAILMNDGLRDLKKVI